MTSFPDFPEPGVLFRDLTPVFTHGPSLRAVVDGMVEPFAGQFDAVAGLEARGFLLAGVAAGRAGVGVLPIRKAGKLPGEVLSESFALEYGNATFDVRPDSLPAGSRVLVMDDVLATGGTLRAAISLVERASWTVVGVSVAIEIDALGGRERLGNHTVCSVVVL